MRDEKKCADETLAKFSPRPLHLPHNQLTSHREPAVRTVGSVVRGRFFRVRLEITVNPSGAPRCLSGPMRRAEAGREQRRPATGVGAMVCQGNGGETPSAAEPKWGVTGDRFAETTGMGHPSRPTGSRVYFGSETDG